MKIKLLFLSGSCSQKSLNKKLARYAAKQCDKEDIEATFIDLADFDIPIYNGDLEDTNGLPENAIKLKKLFIGCDGFFIASPEYNGSFSPLIKNTIDWMSRPHEKREQPLAAYKGKVAAISSISPGALGGLRGLVPLRMLLSNIGVHIIPTQTAIYNGAEAFDNSGNLTNDNQVKMLDNVLKEFIQTTKSYKS